MASDIRIERCWANLVMALNNAAKAMTAKEAVSRFVKDGDSVMKESYTEALPLSLIFEIIRQRTISDLLQPVRLLRCRIRGGSMVEKYQRKGLLHRYCAAPGDAIRARAFLPSKKVQMNCIAIMRRVNRKSCGLTAQNRFGIS